MKQTDRVLLYMQEFGSITTLQAFNDLGIARLASRISELRNQGHNIQSTFITVKNRYGEKTSIKKYYFAGDDNGRH